MDSATQPVSTSTDNPPTAPSGRLPVFALFALGAIFFDESRNVRGDWEYETDPNPKYKPDKESGGKAGLYEDIEENGVNTPLWISILSSDRRAAIHAKTGVWYDAICIRGHRRGRVLRLLAAKYPGRFDRIPCQVYEGLSEADELSMMVDQVHVKGLSQWGIYLAIKSLAMARLSEGKIAARIGMSRGFVQAKLRVARLPDVVETEFLKKCKGQPCVNLTDENLTALFTANLADETARNEGKPAESFAKEWANVVATGTTTKAVPTAMNRKQLLTIIGMTKEPIVADTLRYAAGDPVDLPKILAQVEALRAQALAYLSVVADNPASNPVVIDTTATVVSTEPTAEPTAEPIGALPAPTGNPDNYPGALPTAEPTAPTAEPTAEASAPFETEPTAEPTAKPTGNRKRGNRRK